MDVDVLDRHLLLALATVSVQGLHLGREGPCQLVERLLRRLGLVRAAGGCEAVGEGHHGHVDRRHLRRKHGLHLVSGLNVADHRDHEIDVLDFNVMAVCRNVRYLLDQSIGKINVRRAQGIQQQGRAGLCIGVVSTYFGVVANELDRQGRRWRLGFGSLIERLGGGKFLLCRLIRLHDSLGLAPPLPARRFLIMAHTRSAPYYRNMPPTWPVQVAEDAPEHDHLRPPH